MRVLVIDDDKAVGSALRARFEVGGAQVRCVEGALEGVAALEREDFDLAMIDIVMPGIGGIEAIKLLRQIKPNLPIIAMSGHLERGNQTSAKQIQDTAAGSVYTLAKPFRPRDLDRVVAACLGRPMPGARTARAST